jgi:hypothetical protein
MTEGMTRWLAGTPSPTAWGSCARACRESRGLYATLQRVIDATRAVFQAGGASLALELVAVAALLGAPIAALAAVTATSALSLGLRVAFLRRPRAPDGPGTVGVCGSLAHS